MSIVKAREGPRQESSDRPDRAWRNAERALDIALRLYSNGQLATLAWVAVGRPWRGIRRRDIDLLQEARRVIHDNRGVGKRGDEERVLRAMQRRKGGVKR